jgi:hypothetical protein
MTDNGHRTMIALSARSGSGRGMLSRIHRMKHQTPHQGKTQQRGGWNCECLGNINVAGDNIQTHRKTCDGAKPAKADAKSVRKQLTAPGRVLVFEDPIAAEQKMNGDCRDIGERDCHQRRQYSLQPPQGKEINAEHQAAGHSEAKKLSRKNSHNKLISTHAVRIDTVVYGARLVPELT